MTNKNIGLLHLRYHCGMIIGSMTSPVLEQTGTAMEWLLRPRYRPDSSRARTTEERAEKRGWPLN